MGSTLVAGYVGQNQRSFGTLSLRKTAERFTHQRPVFDSNCQRVGRQSPMVK